MADIADTFTENIGPEKLKLSPRKRPVSRGSDTSSRAGSSRLKAPSLRHRTLSGKSNDSDTSDIYAPQPSWHHLHTSETRRWLGTSDLGSPVSSRAVSPEVPTSPALSAKYGSLRRRKRSLSFGSLHPDDPSARRPSRLAGIGEDVFDEATARTEPQEIGMGRRWLKWMHSQGLRDWVVPCAVLFSIWVKWAIGLGSYSGEATPPMFGDYEAQRHWMELTIHLPFRQWYTYDLQYWGLDYPPLTAYVSWVCGKVGSFLDPTWFALDYSRGIENPGSKVYMRATVIAFDTLIFVPALLWFTRTWHCGRSQRTQNVALLSLLLNPAFLIVDFGHFQYNSVMLGFAILALSAFQCNRDCLGAAFFVLSIGFKQMALYYAPAIGTYLLAKCLYLGPARGANLLVRLGVTTVLSFIVLFSPFLPPFAPLGAVLDPITRIFPFARGLFEDKVANFWCASNVVLKWRNFASPALLIRLSTFLTAAGFLPAVAGMLITGYKVQAPANEKRTKDEEASVPCLQLLPYALLTSAMSFFLFSFQVHEKTILLPLMPLMLLLSGAASYSTVYEWGMLMSNVAMFSMWPLLKRDGLGTQYAATLILWNRLMGYNPFARRPTSFIQFLSLAVYPACIALHVLELVFTPPAHLPDIFPVLNVLACTPVFVLTWLWSIKRGFEVQWALGGLSSQSSATTNGTQTSSSNHSITL